VFPLLIVAFTLAMLALGYFHYHYTWTAFAFPLGAGLAIVLLCAYEIAAPPASAQPAAETPALSLAGLAWLFALAPFLWAFGFVFGAALYLLVSLRGNAFSWRASVITALVSLLVSWGLVIKILGVQLPVRPMWMG